MEWSAHLDLYCERSDPGFWSEPFNAFTNVAFLLSAVIGWRKAEHGDWPAKALALLVAVVGVGSFLFHTLAMRWANLTDVLPIAAFIYAYFVLAMRRFLGLPLVWTILATLLFIAAGLLLERLLAASLGGSAGYVPALLAIFVVALAARPRDPASAFSLAAAGLVFLVSLTLRTIDLAVCDAFPLGTHLFWHLLNASTLGILLVAAADAYRLSPPDARRTSAADCSPKA